MDLAFEQANACSAEWKSCQPSQRSLNVRSCLFMIGIFDFHLSHARKCARSGSHGSRLVVKLSGAKHQTDRTGAIFRRASSASELIERNPSVVWLAGGDRVLRTLSYSCSSTSRSRASLALQ
ncbi:MAG TPA: hypothetical protein VGF94_22540, partial [Kofleriaceae bacterium]